MVNTLTTPWGVLKNRDTNPLVFCNLEHLSGTDHSMFHKHYYSKEEGFDGYQIRWKVWGSQVKKQYIFKKRLYISILKRFGKYGDTSSKRFLLNLNRRFAWVRSGLLIRDFYTSVNGRNLNDRCGSVSSLTFFTSVFLWVYFILTWKNIRVPLLSEKMCKILLIFIFPTI